MNPTRSMSAAALAVFLFAMPFRMADASEGLDALPAVLKVCDIGNEWPPYTFYKRENGRQTKEVVGYSVDFLKAILRPAGIDISVQLLPWKRCQHMVDTGAYDLLLNASLNLDRAARFLVSKPYYELTDVYVSLSRRRIPLVATPQDFSNLNVCGEMGYNYWNFGLPDERIDTSYQTLGAAIKKLHAGYCDVVLTRLEIAAAQKFLGDSDYVSDPQYQVRKLPYAAPTPFHMMLSRRTRYAKTLLDAVNQGIDRLQQSGEASSLMQNYR